MKPSDVSNQRQRRAHRKSRLGCLQCKQRKIKCDESQPACLNCIRRDTICSSPSRPANRTGSPTVANPGSPARPYKRGIRFVPSKVTTEESTAEAHEESEDTCSEASVGDPQSLQIKLLSQRLATVESQLRLLLAAGPNSSPSHIGYVDVELWHHYATIMDYGVVSNVHEARSRFWTAQLPQMAFEHPHILHLILGFAALHKSRLCADRRLELRDRAARHNDVGTHGATAMLSSVGAAGYPAAYASAVLITLFYLARGPRSNEYIAFGNSGPGDFFVLMRGVRSIRELNETNHPEPPTSRSEPFVYTSTDSNCGLDLVSPSPHDNVPYQAYLDYLRTLAARTDNADTMRLYFEALSSLEIFWVAAAGSEDVNSAAKAAQDPHRNLPFAWLYRLSDGFVELLQRRDPLSLAIFACWAVVLGKLENGWIIEGWPEHIISGLDAILGTAYGCLLSWSKGQIRQAKQDMESSPA